jgi:hypothetical protein
MIRPWFILILIFSSLVISGSEQAGIGEKKEENVIDAAKDGNGILDFSSIKDLIKKDGLESELKKKNEETRRLLDEKNRIEMRKFNFPTEDKIWSILSELWLVKNATKLKWDFHKPDFELEKAFASFLESQGFYEKKFKILLLDTPELSHAGLPSNNDELIFLVSLPFIRTLDLSKVEISIILFEDFLRLKAGYLQSFIESKELKLLYGTNFKSKPFDKAVITSSLSKYNKFLFEKGFSFQDQFEVTKEMDSYLKNDLKIWNTYLTLLQKIDELVKTNTLYKNYGQIYPSPELQINWIRPKKTTL